jgi:PadR family transcriptional regulator PadR
MKGESLKGHLDLLILAVLAEAPRHGYAVIEELRERSGEVFDLGEGTVYPVLHRLERAGLLSSEWGDAGGRRRRSYHITAAGTAKLAVDRANWNRFVSGVAAVIGRSPWPSTP